MSGLHTCMDIGDTLQMSTPEGARIALTVSGKNGRRIRLCIEATDSVRIERAGTFATHTPNPNEEKHHGEYPV